MRRRKPLKIKANSYDLRHIAAILKRKPLKTFSSMRVLLSVSGICAVLLAGVLVLWLVNLGIFDFDENKFDFISNKKGADTTLVFSKSGEKIGEFYNKFQMHVDFKAIPGKMVKAIVAIEDRKFFHHPGIDVKGIVRAAIKVLKREGYSQGASTITQQVVRHYLLPKEKTMNRKVQEISLAIQMERQLSKERIFELYVNDIYLGNHSYGVAAAAKRYFSKTLSQLSLAETALIAGLFQSPSRYNPTRNATKAIKRRKQVIKAMLKSGYISKAQALKANAEKLVLNEYIKGNQSEYPYFVDHIRERAEKLLGKHINNKGLRIFTTLDKNLQKLAKESVNQSADHLKHMEKYTFKTGTQKFSQNQQDKKHRIEASILVTDPKTGQILAMVGGRDYKTSQFNRTTNALRSPGSALKPVTYSLALERGHKWSDMIFVSPVSINNYRPRNHKGEFLTETTLLRAFYRSMNTTTVELANKIGLRNIIAHAKKLGIQTPLKREIGTVLGGSEMTMLELNSMYSTFANRGVYTEPVAILAIKDRNGKVLYRADTTKQRQKRAISDKSAFLMVEGLRKVLQRGTAYKSHNLANFAVGKTGTSNDSKDNWFCGFSENLTTTVWVGMDKNGGIAGRATGASMALPIWDRFMSRSLKYVKPGSFKKPDGIVSVKVHAKYGHKTPSGVEMFFHEGHEPEKETSPLEEMGRSSDYRSVFFQ